MNPAPRAAAPRSRLGRMRSLRLAVRPTFLWVDLGLILALFALTAASYAYAALIVDSGRDLAWGLSIARGEAFPWYGPSLNGLWQPGPVWYYLLALLLGATGSVGATVGALGLLAATKVPLAYLLGRDALGRDEHNLPGPDRALGLALAGAIALPGWNTLAQLALSHTMLVEVAVLATLWLALRAWRSERAALAVAAALALGLAVHAHPTALVATPAVALALWHTARAPRQWHWLLLAAFAFAFPFLPALIAEFRSGWPQWGANAAYFGNSDYLARLARASDVLRGASFGSVAFVREFLMGRWPAVAWLAGSVLLVLPALALVGLLRGVRREHANGLLLAFAAFAWIFVLLLRDQTPAWMVYACAPFNAALLALGWMALWRESARPRAARVLATLAVVFAAALLVDRIATTRSGVQSLPSAAIADIAAIPAHDPWLRFWLPAWGHDAVAKRLCAVDAPVGQAVALHGDLATAIHFGQGVAVALHCAAAREVRLGGEAARHIVGVPRDVAASLRIEGRATAWGYVLIEPEAVLHPRQGARVLPHTRYLMDDYILLQRRRRHGLDAAPSIALTHACQAGDLLVATNLLPLLNAPFEVRGWESQPMTVRVAETIASRYFDCPSNGRFAFELVTLDPRTADVFVLRRKASERKP